MYYKTLFLLYIVFIFCYSSCGNAKNGKNENIKEAHQFTNELSKESSPYLLQHAHNPVNWLPWGEKALKKAKDENKMIIISIGYAACHWCHVMEHESFEDTAVARLMNENFIAIKVDREERPDVDQVYMTAAQLISGNGGWPLNALALPDGRPFYAGTYYPKNEWVKMLTYFINAWKKDEQPLIKQAEEITKGIHSSENITFKKEEKKPTLRDLDNQFMAMKRNVDFEKGGMNRTPKFPMPANWEYLLRYNYISKNNEALKAVEITLNKMAFGGIYDQLGGGFARYSTDADWHVPHFEKMLYDNAQLVSLYAHAFQKTKHPLYKKVVYETLEFVRLELTSPEGGFYSSLDADSNGEEGKYYVWTKEEIEKLLGLEAPVFISYYNITKAGNWEKGNNILMRKESDEAIAKKNGITVATLNKKIEEATKKLLKTRSARIKPALDDKVLSSWNALMLNGYVQAYIAFGDEVFLNAAIANANFLMNNAIATNGEMTRIFKNGKSSINGMLDDYAFTISAFIELYQATFEEKWLNIANKMTSYVQEHFFDPASRMFFYTHNEYSNLIARKMEISDNVIPASNSEMAKNLLILGHYFYNSAYVSMAKQMLANVASDLQANINFYSNWGILETMLASPFYEVAILGNDFKNKRQEFDQYYLPNMLLMGGKEEGKLELLESKLVEGQTTIYVCKEKVCKQPVTEVVKALVQIGN